MECKNCGNEIKNISVDNGNFCSISCLRSYTAHIRHQNGKYENHLKNLHQKRQAPYGTWKCDICGEIFPSRRFLSSHRKEMSHYKLKPGGGALRGLTKDTSEIAKKISQTLKEKYKNKQIQNYWTGKHLSREHREKISASRMKTIDTNFRCGKRLDVKWYRVKNLNNCEFIVRGHWEEQVAIRLNKDNILWDRGKFLTYETDITHRYTPDFHITNTNKFIEVKGYFPEQDFNKMKITISQHPEIELYCIDSKKYKGFISGKISLDECRFA